MSVRNDTFKTVKMWADTEEWLRHTVIAMSLLNLIILIATIISFTAVAMVRRRCYELRLFLSCMERQLQRSVLPTALMQRAIEMAAVAQSYKGPSATMTYSARSKIEGTCAASLPAMSVLPQSKKQDSKKAAPSK